MLCATAFPIPPFGSPLPFCLSPASCSVTPAPRAAHADTTGLRAWRSEARRGLLCDLFPEATLPQKSVHPGVEACSHPPEEGLSLLACPWKGDTGHFLRGFQIKASPLLTCLFGWEPAVAQGGLSASQAPRHILTLAVQEGEAFGEPRKGHAACCKDRETESQSKKGVSPGHTARVRPPGVPGNPRCCLPGPLGGLCGLQHPRAGAQVEEKQFE